VRLSASFFASFSIGEHASVVRGLIASRADARGLSRDARRNACFFGFLFFSSLPFFSLPSSFSSSAISFGRRRAAGILQS